MRFQCEHCNTVVESSEPQSINGGMALVCTNCGGLNWIVQPPGATAPAPITKDVKESLVSPSQPIFKQSPPKAEPPVATKQKEIKIAKPAEPRSLTNADLAVAITKAKILWSRLENENFEDQTAHKNFLQFCSQVDILDFAAYCYRKRMFERNEADPISKWAIDHIINLATVRYLAPAPAEDRKNSLSPRARKILWFVITGGLAILFYLVSYLIMNMDLMPKFVQ